MTGRYDALVFDLLTALLDSWALWSKIAGSEDRGRTWRNEYLKRVYATGAYRPIEMLVCEAAEQVGYPRAYGEQLVERWDELEPWPGVVQTLNRLRGWFRMGVVTNCSEALAQRAAKRVGEFSVVVSAERAGFYKPHERTYGLALEELGVSPKRALFVAGSVGDLTGAARAGMPVFWHNHIGLKRPEGVPAPMAETRDFVTLGDFVLRPA